MPLVSTTSGLIEGNAWAKHETGGIFLGVPFAAPPVGERRWQPPQPVPETASVTRAQAFAPACMQGDYIVSWYEGLASSFGADPEGVGKPTSESEDCLYLNIWTPDLAPDAPLPVMVWIHGGSYRGGWSYEPNYHGTELAGQGVVLVSIAHRLGPFGYLGPGADEGAPLNFGMMDQLAALEWVQQNIGAFGGDAASVTVFGESAGAAAIGTLLVTPEANGLFHRAISQSAGFEFLPAPDRDQAGEAFASLARALEATGTTPSDASAEEILQASNAALADYDFGPVVDGDLLDAQPAARLTSGHLNAVDLIIGTNRDEWLMYLDPASVDQDLADWKAKLPDAADLIGSLVNDLGADQALDRIETAHQMRCPGRALASAVSAAGEQAYVYEFNRRRERSVEAGLGSYHGAEVPYVFGTHDDWLPTTDLDRDITAAMMQAWTSFAAQGEPRLPGDTNWPEFGATGMVLSIDQPFETSQPTDEALCAYLLAPQPEGAP